MKKGEKITRDQKGAMNVKANRRRRFWNQSRNRAPGRYQVEMVVRYWLRIEFIFVVAQEHVEREGLRRMHAAAATSWHSDIRDTRDTGWCVLEHVNSLLTCRRHSLRELHEELVWVATRTNNGMQSEQFIGVKMNGGRALYPCCWLAMKLFTRMGILGVSHNSAVAISRLHGVHHSESMVALPYALHFGIRVKLSNIQLFSSFTHILFVHQWTSLPVA